ncbi:MAG: diaminopimelate decarboxylase [Bdellovibrio sp.]|nr:diaminopimelate decarboxylase [Bdellovibrio sp.]
MALVGSFFKYKNGTLTIEEIALKRIAEKTRTPVYIYSQKAILQTLSMLKKALSGVELFICYAVKANANPTLLELFAKQGIGADIVSGGELKQVMHSGMRTSGIVFSGVGKMEHEIRAALEKNIYAFHVESEEELFVINDIAKSSNKKASIAFRWNPDVDAKTHRYIATGLKKNKFGLNKSEIFSLLKKRNQLKYVDFKGVSIHIGSQIITLKPFQEAFYKTQTLILEIQSMLAKKLSFVSLGGGLGITYKNEKPFPLKEYGKLILKLFGPASKTPLKVILEPGRFLVGNAGVLLTKVLYRKKRKEKDFLILDAGMNDLLRPALYQSYHEILPLDEALLKGKYKKTDLVGPVCESSDFFALGRLFPTGVNRGDYLAVFSAGAYGYSMGSQYNLRPRPVEVWVTKDARAS